MDLLEALDVGEGDEVLVRMPVQRRTGRGAIVRLFHADGRGWRDEEIRSADVVAVTKCARVARAFAAFTRAPSTWPR